MGNMSYCRFRNTYSDVYDCIEALEAGEATSDEECNAAKRMLTTVLDFCRSEGIIGDYDTKRLKAAVDELKED